MPLIEELVGDGTDGRVTAVLGPEEDGFMALRGHGTESVTWEENYQILCRASEVRHGGSRNNSCSKPA